MQADPSALSPPSELTAVLTHLQEGVIVSDAATRRLVFANALAARIAGFDSPEAMQGLPMEQFDERLRFLDAQGAPFPREALPFVRAARGEHPPPVEVRAQTALSQELQWFVLHAIPVFAADGSVRQVVKFLRRTTELRRAEQSLRFIVKATELLNATLDYERTLQAVAQVVVPELADGCIIVLRQEVGPLRQLAFYSDPELARRFDEMWPRYQVRPDAPVGPGYVLRSGQPSLVAEYTEEVLRAMTMNEEHYQLFRGLGFRSSISVPLTLHGRSLGLLALVRVGASPPYTGADLSLAQEVANRAAPALENARQLQLLRAAEARSRASEERMVLALEAGQMGCFEVDMRAGRVFTTPRVEELLEVPPGTGEKGLDALYVHVHPEDRAQLRRQGEEYDRNERTSLAFEYRVLLADGSVRWLEAQSRLTRDEAGAPARRLGVLRDITARRRMEARELQLATEQAARAKEQEAAARRAHYEALRADVGTALSSPAPLLEMVSLCAGALTRHLGLAVASLWEFNRAENALDFIATSGGEGRVRRLSMDDPLALPVREKRPWIVEDLRSDPFFAPRTTLLRRGLTSFIGYPLQIGETAVGMVTMFSRAPLSPDAFPTLAALMDTIAQGLERKRAEESLAARASELARSNAELEQFAYVASHDLQAPLRMVSNYAQLLARRYKGRLDSDADDFIHFLVDGAERMRRLIQGLLTYARVETKKKQGGALPPVRCEEVLRHVLHNLEGALQDCGGELSHGPLPVVLGDEMQLEQLFQNLISNAIKFRGEAAPRVEISAERREHDWLFAVKDNGIGIEARDFERLFGLFQRVNSDPDRFPGTGIGLAVCKKIVERHGGRIWLESTPGQGTTFFFTLEPVPASVEPAGT